MKKFNRNAKKEDYEALEKRLEGEEYKPDHIKRRERMDYNCQYNAMFRGHVRAIKKERLQTVADIEERDEALYDDVAGYLKLLGAVRRGV